MGTYCLILTETETDKSKIASFMAAALGLEQKEAELRLRTSPGFLLENADFEPAMATQAGAAKAGLKTMVIENSSLAVVPRPLAVQKL